MRDRPFSPFTVWVVSRNPAGKQHEKYQGIKIYGTQRIENFHIPTSKKFLTCFICDESRTYRKSLKQKQGKQTGIYSGNSEQSFNACSASNNAH
jgi:hypothetical protein